MGLLVIERGLILGAALALNACKPESKSPSPTEFPPYQPAAHCESGWQRVTNNLDDAKSKVPKQGDIYMGYFSDGSVYFLRRVDNTLICFDLLKSPDLITGSST